MEKLIEKLPEKLRRLYGNIFKTLIDILFPQDPLTSALEAIGKSDVKTRRDFFELLPAAPPAPPEYPWIHSCFAYKNAAVERIVWAVKYERNRALASLIAEAVLAKILGILANANHSQIPNGKVVLIPLPSSKKRICERGYDHIGLIAEALQLNKKLPGRIQILPILKKRRHTKPQSKLGSREERLHNLVGAFAVDEKWLVEIDLSNNYILIDDVCTTGATLAAGRECLLAAGAVNVEAITFAR